MILIVTSEDDLSTNHVINWLNHFGKDFIRINETTEVILKNLTISKERIDCEIILNDNFHKNKEFKISDISSYWYRRGRLNIKTNYFNSISFDKKSQNNLNSYLYDEKVQIEEIIINENSCGKIHKLNFAISMDVFIESQNHNTCLNKKIS